MDTAYAAIGVPFGQALSILATVVSVNRGGWAVADCGLKALGMDHGNPSLSDGSAVWYCSDEHVIFSPPEGGSLPRVGDQVRVLPATSTPLWLTTSACTWWRATGSWRHGRWTCGAGARPAILLLAARSAGCQAGFRDERAGGRAGGRRSALAR